MLAARWDTRPVADKDEERFLQLIDGANDGASGVGVLLALGQVTSKLPPYCRPLAWRASFVQGISPTHRDNLTLVDKQTLQAVGETLLHVFYTVSF